MKKTIEQKLGNIIWKGVVNNKHARIVAEGDDLSVILYEYEVYKRKAEPVNQSIIWKAQQIQKELGMELKIPDPIYESSTVKNLNELNKLMDHAIKTGELQDPRPFYIDEGYNKYELCIRSEQHCPYIYVLNGNTEFELPEEAQELVRPYEKQYTEYLEKRKEKWEKNRREELLKEAKELGLL